MVIAVDVIVFFFSALFWVIGGLLAFILICSCIPLQASGKVQGLNMSEMSEANFDDVSWQGKVSWLLGLVQFEVYGAGPQAPLVRLHLFGIKKRLSQATGRSDSQRSTKPRSRKVRKEKKTRQQGVHWRDFRQLIPEARRLLSKLWRTLRMQGRGHITYGFDDPFTTGMSQAILSAVRLPPQLIIVPDFTEAKLKGWAEVSVTIYPIEGMLVVISSLFRPALRQFWWPRLRTAIRL